MNSAYNYKYAATPSDYYDYNYDSTLTEVPARNFYKNQNNLYTRLSTASRDDHYGASGYGGGCYEEGVSIGLLLTTAFGIAIMGYTLYTKVKANGGKKRKKRGVLDNVAVKWLSLFPEIMLMGKSLISKQPFVSKMFSGLDNPFV